MKQGIALAELAAELERQEAVKADYVADTKYMHMISGRHEDGPRFSELDLLGNEGAAGVFALKVNDHCHGQIATHLGIPTRYYDRLRDELPVLLDENVNRLFRHANAPRMVRVLDGTARAFLSDRYRRLDNAELARVVLPILGDIPDVRVESCALTDTRMYIKAITPRISGEVKVGEEVCAGVLIANSEVGAGSLRVSPFTYTLACTNGMVVSKDLGGVALRRIHVGRRIAGDEESYRVFRDETLQADDQAFFMAVADVVRAAVDEVRFREVIEAMRAAAESTPLTSVLGGVQQLAKVENLTDGERDSVLTHLAAGGDLSRWGVVSAVTRASQDVESYDRATELEELGGKVLSYSAREWRTLAEAA